VKMRVGWKRLAQCFNTHDTQPAYSVSCGADDPNILLGRHRNRAVRGFVIETRALHIDAQFPNLNL
jgi:hypothetical protein